MSSFLLYTLKFVDIFHDTKKAAHLIELLGCGR